MCNVKVLQFFSASWVLDAFGSSEPRKPMMMLLVSHASTSTIIIEWNNPRELLTEIFPIRKVCDDKQQPLADIGAPLPMDNPQYALVQISLQIFEATTDIAFSGDWSDTRKTRRCQAEVQNSSPSAQKETPYRKRWTLKGDKVAHAKGIQGYNFIVLNQL